MLKLFISSSCFSYSLSFQTVFHLSLFLELFECSIVNSFLEVICLRSFIQEGFKLLSSFFLFANTSFQPIHYLAFLKLPFPMKKSDSFLTLNIIFKKTSKNDQTNPLFSTLPVSLRTKLLLNKEIYSTFKFIQD